MPHVCSGSTGSRGCTVWSAPTSPHSPPGPHRGTHRTSWSQHTAQNSKDHTGCLGYMPHPSATPIYTPHPPTYLYIDQSKCMAMIHHAVFPGKKLALRRTQQYNSTAYIGHVINSIPFQRPTLLLTSACSPPTDSKTATHKPEVHLNMIKMMILFKDPEIFLNVSPW